MPTPTYDLIASNVLSSSASSVTFSSIPATYRDLVLVVWAVRDTSNFNVSCILNSDSGANYSWVAMAGTGSSTASATDSARNDIPLGFFAQARDTAHLSISHFMDYSATNKHKTVLTRGNNAANGAAAHAARWANTSAITSIQIINDGGVNYGATSSFYLYGIVS